MTLQRVFSRILIAKPCAYQNLTRTANNVCAINNIRFVCITFDVYFYFLINYEYRPKINTFIYTKYGVFELSIDKYPTIMKTFPVIPPRFL